jgi:hypothetical protein
MVMVDLPTVTGQWSAPGGSIVNGDSYGTPATWRVELNPNWPTQANQYRIIRVSDGAIFSTDTRYNQPLTDAALADACRRAGPGQIIEIGPGCDLRQVNVGGTDTAKIFCAWWGHFAGPFDQFTGLTIRSQYPSQPARVRGFLVARTVRNNQGITFDHGPCSIAFEYIEFHWPPGSLYIWQTPIGELEQHGLFSFDHCDFTGVKGYSSGYDTKSALRGAYASWSFQDCRFPETQEHGVYVDAPQGLFRMLRCFNTSSSGPAGARMGRTFTQIVSRANTDPNDGFAGGPAGFGTVLWEDCVALRTGTLEFSGAYTVAQFLGRVIIRRCSAPETNAGMITVWVDFGKGVHTTQGTFITAPWPVSGSAFATKYLLIEDFDGYVASPWPNQTNHIAISGVELVEIGAFNLGAGGRPRFAFWPVGPFDNGEVRFLAPPLSSPISDWGGFGTLTDRATYGTSSNPNQGPPNGTGSSGRLSATGLDALENVNDAYPPWPQALAGSVFLSPAVETWSAPPGSVEFTSGLTIFLDPPPVVQSTSPAGDVLLPIVLDLPSVVIASSSPAGTIDAPLTIQLPRLGATFRAPTGSVDIGLAIDFPELVLTASAPAGTVAHAIDLPRATLVLTPQAISIEFGVQLSAAAATFSSPAGSVTQERTVDLPSVAIAAAAPAGSLEQGVHLPAVAIATSSPTGSVTQERTVDLPSLLLTASAPAGETLQNREVNLPTVVLATSSPAGSLEQGVHLPAVAIASSSPAGSTQSGLIIDLDPASALWTSPAGEILRDLDLPPVTITTAAPEGVVDGVVAALQFERGLTVPTVAEARLALLDDQVETELFAPSKLELRLVVMVSIERQLESLTAVEQDLQVIT